jgi:hypothetical protein
VGNRSEFIDLMRLNSGLFRAPDFPVLVQTLHTRTHTRTRTRTRADARTRARARARLTRSDSTKVARLFRAQSLSH